MALTCEVTVGAGLKLLRTLLGGVHARAGERREPVLDVLWVGRRCDCLRWISKSAASCRRRLVDGRDVRHVDRCCGYLRWWRCGSGESARGRDCTLMGSTAHVGGGERVIYQLSGWRDAGALYPTRCLRWYAQHRLGLL